MVDDISVTIPKGENFRHGIIGVTTKKEDSEKVHYDLTKGGLQRLKNALEVLSKEVIEGDL